MLSEYMSNCCNEPAVIKKEYDNFIIVCSKCGKECEAVLTEEEEKQVRNIIITLTGSDKPAEIRGNDKNREYDCIIWFIENVHVVGMVVRKYIVQLFGRRAVETLVDKGYLREEGDFVRLAEELVE